MSSAVEEVSHIQCVTYYCPFLKKKVMKVKEDGQLVQSTQIGRSKESGLSSDLPDSKT